MSQNREQLYQRIRMTGSKNKGTATKFQARVWLNDRDFHLNLGLYDSEHEAHQVVLNYIRKGIIPPHMLPKYVHRVDDHGQLKTSREGRTHQEGDRYVGRLRLQGIEYRTESFPTAQEAYEAIKAMTEEPRERAYQERKRRLAIRKAALAERTKQPSRRFDADEFDRKLDALFIEVTSGAARDDGIDEEDLRPVECDNEISPPPSKISQTITTISDSEEQEKMFTDDQLAAAFEGLVKERLAERRKQSVEAEKTKADEKAKLVSRRLLAWCLVRGMDSSDIAEKSGLNVKAVYNIVTTGKPSPKHPQNFKKVLSALRITEVELFTVELDEMLKAKIPASIAEAVTPASEPATAVEAVPAPMGV